MSENELIVLFFVLMGIYFLEHLFYSVGVWRGITAPGAAPFEEEKVHASGNDRRPLPSVTVLVCARDEELNIDRCVESLSQLNYPKEKLELLIVDDKSSDRTPDILREWQERVTNLRVLRTGEEVEHLRGKVNALTQGMDEATGEIVIVTDADSQVHRNWVREYVRYYDDSTGLVASITLLNINSVMDGLQSLDWAYLLGISCACTNVSIPLSVIGNNMSVRKAAYDDVGGYRKIPFSVTEDYALFRAIWDKQPWKIRYVIHPDLTVMSAACPDFQSWWRQKHRWVKGGEGLKLLGYVIFITGLIGNLAMILAPFLFPLSAAVAIIGLKWLSDLLIILPVLARTKMNGLLKYFLLFEIYFPLFVLSMPIMIMQKNVKWKGRIYKH